MLRGLALLSMLVCSAVSVSSQCQGNSSTPLAETQYLHDLFLSTNGHDWSFLPPGPSGQVWNFTQRASGEFLFDPCMDSWQGVFCANTTNSSDDPLALPLACHITELNLEYMNLQGTIPPDVTALQQLQVLEMGHNDITGSLPADMYDLSSLRELRINYNSLDGLLAPDVSKLLHLARLALYSNRLTGPLPEELGLLTELTYLALSRNLLSHTVPDTMASLTRLRSLWLDENALSGPMPPFIGHLTALTHVVLYGNDFTGEEQPTSQSVSQSVSQ
jgi:hypothetical protein